MSTASPSPTTDRDRLGLHADCESCFGLCCVALAFTRSADFPIDKDVGTPCRNLRPDHRCSIHSDLRGRGFVGCTVYDCFGAGQKISRTTFDGKDWRTHPEVRASMFALLPVLRHVHELLWYLTEAIASTSHDTGLATELRAAVDRIERLSLGTPDELLAQDLDVLRGGVNPLLLQASESARSRSRHQPRGRRADHRGADLVGGRLAGADLRGASLRGALLVGADLRGADLRGADLIGADLRGADVHGADLTEALFLTQAQVDAARGDTTTCLPAGIERPGHWSHDPSSPSPPSRHPQGKRGGRSRGASRPGR